MRAYYFTCEVRLGFGDECESEVILVIRKQWRNVLWGK